MSVGEEELQPLKIGINGFGRIGRAALRVALKNPRVKVVAINHTCDSVEDLIYLIKYDSTHGRFSVDDKLPIHAADDNILIVGENAIHLSSERDIGRLDWTQSSTEYVLECTGKFTKLADASRHITDAGAKRVVISAPSKDAPTFVCGVNTHKFREAPGDTNEVVSNASCTTNCAAPLVSVLNEAFTIEEAFLTTVHSTTQSQKILDSYSRKGKRAGRAVLNNIIPSTTGAAKAVAQVIPSLAGKITGMSVRVPTANVSMVDLTVRLGKPTNLDELLQTLDLASTSPRFRGILCVEHESLVSSDFIGHPSSSIVDATACMGLNDKFFKIIAWYDNEWAYASRLVDLALLLRHDGRLP